MDAQITILINRILSYGPVGSFMLFITEPSNWYIPIIIFFACIMYLDWRKGLVALVGVAIAVGISDAVSHNLIKEFFARVRPCHDIKELLVLAGCTGSYSMPSNHAVNTFCMAAFLSRLYPKTGLYLFGIAVAVALSRVAVGVHYFSDILAGAAVGLIFGLPAGWFTLRLVKGLSKNSISTAND